MFSQLYFEGIKMTESVLIRVHTDLKQQIKIQSAKAGLTMNDYLRKLVNEDASKLES